MNPQRAPALSIEQQLHTPQGPLFVRVDAAAAPSAPTVVLLHALGTDMSIWDPLVHQLQASRSVIRIDAPGHGRSPAWSAGAVTLDTLAQSVVAVLAQLVPETPVDMLGTSMGAVMALHAASHAPERIRRLVLCGALLVRSSEAAADMQQRAAAIVASGMGPLTEAMLARWFPPRRDGDDTDAIIQLRALMLRTPPQAYVACSDAMSRYDLTDALRSKQRDILLISGDRDGEIPHQLGELHRLCPETRHLCLADTGHFPHLQRPQAFAQAAHAFFASA